MQPRRLESEIHDLQGEFELDRLDYLETIRKQDQQLKLLQQVLDKIQPTISRASNYANLERVKKEAMWNEDQGRWVLPEMTSQKLAAGLPTASQVSSGARPELAEASYNNYYDDDERAGAESRLKKRLDASMERDFAANYFKPQTASRANIMEKYNPERHKSQMQEKISNFVKRNQKAEHLMSGVVYTDELYDEGADGDAAGGGGGRRRGDGPKSASMNRRTQPSPSQRLEALNGGAAPGRGK